MRMFHGSSSQTLALHEGLCLAEDENIARDYAIYTSGDSYLHDLELSFAGLTVTELDEGYDRDANIAPADLDPSAFPGTDIITFTDETITGREHVTYRLLTPAALAAVTVMATSDADDY
jgi:hypothetical protein